VRCISWKSFAIVCSQRNGAITAHLIDYRKYSAGRGLSMSSVRSLNSNVSLS
jgi:hypothetical protein